MRHDWSLWQYKLSDFFKIKPQEMAIQVSSFPISLFYLIGQCHFGCAVFFYITLSWILLHKKFLRKKISFCFFCLFVYFFNRQEYQTYLFILFVLKSLIFLTRRFLAAYRSVQINYTEGGSSWIRSHKTLSTQRHTIRYKLTFYCTIALNYTGIFWLKLSNTKKRHLFYLYNNFHIFVK